MASSSVDHCSLDRPLRVAMCLPSYAPAYDHGGPIRSMEGLANALQLRTVEVSVLTTNARSRGTLDVPRGWTEYHGVPVKYLPRWLVHDVTPRYFAEACSLAKRSDVIHTGGVFGAVTVQTLLASAATRTPLVHSPRGAFEPASLARGRTRLKTAWIRAFLPLFRRVTLFHATSESEAASIEQVVGSGARVEVVPNGTDLPDLPEEPRLSGAGRLVVAAMGRVHPNKGFDRLLRAVALVRREGLDCALRVAGPMEDERHAEELRRLIRELGVSGNAELVGEVTGEAKRRFFLDADLFVLSSHGTENFGNVVIEALAHRLPVVASDQTPWRHLEDVGCGLVAPNTPEGLAAGILRLASDPDGRREAGRRGRALAAREYSWQAVAPKMIALYRSAIRRAAGHHGPEATLP